MSSVFYTWRQAVMRSELAAPTKHVLLTLGCYMNDVGESCFPSIATLSRDTSMSKVSIIKHLKLAEEAGFLAKSKHGYAGQKWRRNEYYAVFPGVDCEDNFAASDVDDAAKKVVKEVNHLDEKVVNLGGEGGKPQSEKVVKEVNTISPYNYQYNNTARARHDASSQEKYPTPEATLACRLMPMNVAVTSMHPTLLKWVADGIDEQLILDCIALARQRKPWPETIAANYLDAIIRSEQKPKAYLSWLRDDNATIAKGRELGIDAKRGEPMADYRARLKAAVLGGAS